MKKVYQIFYIFFLYENDDVSFHYVKSESTIGFINDDKKFVLIKNRNVWFKTFLQPSSANIRKTKTMTAKEIAVY